MYDHTTIQICGTDNERTVEFLLRRRIAQFLRKSHSFSFLLSQQVRPVIKTFSISRDDIPSRPVALRCSRLPSRLAPFFYYIPGLCLVVPQVFCPLVGPLVSLARGLRESHLLPIMLSFLAHLPRQLDSQRSSFASRILLWFQACVTTEQIRAESLGRSFERNVVQLSFSSSADPDITKSHQRIVRLSSSFVLSPFTSSI